MHNYVVSTEQKLIMNGIIANYNNLVLNYNFSYICTYMTNYSELYAIAIRMLSFFHHQLQLMYDPRQGNLSKCCET